MKKRIIMLTMLAVLASPELCRATECEAIRDCGVESVGNPYRAQATAYCEPGKLTATGSNKQNGIVAGCPEWIGSIAAVYLVEEDGSIGEFIGLYPVEDTGFGRAIESDGYKSEILKNKKPGTVETGITLDFRQKSYSDCKNFMLMTYTGHGSTGSEVWVQIIRGEG